MQNCNLSLLLFTAIPSEISQRDFQKYSKKRKEREEINKDEQNRRINYEEHTCTWEIMKFLLNYNFNLVRTNARSSLSLMCAIYLAPWNKLTRKQSRWHRYDHFLLQSLFSQPVTEKTRPRVHLKVKRSTMMKATRTDKNSSRDGCPRKLFPRKL